MFELLALGLCGAPGMWSKLLSDITERVALALIEAGQKNFWSGEQS
jgi:hypothetical protein